MIGRIQEKNVSVPVQETFPTETIFPKDDAFNQAENQTPHSSFGVASVQDGFEKAKEDDLLEKIGVGAKSVVDPIGYPGEEWLWSNTEEL